LELYPEDPIGNNQMGVIYWMRLEDWDKAIELLRQAASYLPYEADQSDQHIEFFDPLAWAYYKSGDLENARLTYEKITRLTTGRLQGMNYLYAHSFYMLGKVHGQEGEKSKARANYQKFLGPLEGRRPRPPRSRGRQKTAGWAA